MRTELKALEGDLVYLRGRATEARRDGEHLHLMLRRPTLQRWDGVSAVGLGERICTDHLWVRLNPKQWEGEMLAAVCGIGRVGYYRRADGTIDLGVTVLPCLDMDRLVAEATAAMREAPRRGVSATKEALEDIRIALSALMNQGQGAYAISRKYSSIEAAKILTHEHQLIQASVDATEAALLSGRTKGHKPRDLDLPLRNCRKSAA